MSECHYKLNHFYPSKAKLQVFFFERLGMPSGFFSTTIRKFTNGLLNTSGGLMVFGVNDRGYVSGLRTLTRQQEDVYRLQLDQEMRMFMPTVSPSLYRFSIVATNIPGYCVVEIKINAGPVGEMFQDGDKEVHIIRKGGLYGPLIPQEIKELVLAKYKEEMLTSHQFLSPVKGDQ